MNKLIVTLITLLLTACGGGSGDSQGQTQTNNTASSATSNAGQSSAANTEQTQTANAAEQDSNSETQEGSAEEAQNDDTQPAQDSGSTEGMEAVIVDEAFDFRTDVPVAVSIASNVVNSRAFINICQQDAPLTDDDTCFLRAPVDSNGLFVQIVLPHSEQKLKAEIWYYSTDVEPLVYNWEFDGSQQQQTWEIN
ncbi:MULTISPECIES: hypothetical protein [unclassified Pseudoalteromonas]|uniref:hypothetical protein n=1 Tax=unclassified Pseudoalteromonas TaxID=194690 RepID=UPI0020984F74|nr:hypothetical protein [Pseudoalteromonas sp. XMcav2-N]MCO7187198.1 hypothetical protein [Pseudoalteromonas sp. XMcav2-N]